MRYMLIVKSNGYSEAGVKPSLEFIEALAAYNDSLSNAGILLANEALLPSSSGVRIVYSEHAEKPKLTVGPFAEVQDMFTAFTVIEVRSVEEAIDWALRMPISKEYGEYGIELRQLCEVENEREVPLTIALEVELRDQIGMLIK
ncbi:YciI family protein [Paenibacillus sp. GSMTC-2017]|uniref:YciI family protein n=1 Tax=Paenibacillus sp. GSMTC-2017 TaxID=2794350 RepID=UPI0018D72710|nr:YciI family protein [Paenibacillus sp. GSMTC-2017]MBH5318826.1 YciI family protein [Paenibacillus sp. GSMTC-2017]